MILRRVRRRLRGVPLGPRHAEAAFNLLGDLNRWGWADSLGQLPSIQGQPVPWITYAAIVWMWPRLAGDERVLEIGAGASTFWFAERVDRVISLEHSRAWFQRLSESKPSNVELILVNDSQVSVYLDSVEAAARQFGPFDIIMIDGGPDRVASMRTTHPHLAEKGLIVLDNSDVSGSQAGIRSMAEAGFYRQDLFGPTPGSRYLGCTTLFSRDFHHWLARERAVVLPIPFFEDMDSPFRD